MVHIAQRHRQGHCFTSLILYGDDGLVFDTLRLEAVSWAKSHEILIKYCTPYK